MLLEVKDLRTSFFTDNMVIKAVDGVSFGIKKGQTLGIVGESGCGKSVTALSIMRLVPKPRGKIVGGEIIYKGKNLLELSDEEMRRIRGKEIAMIFQDPMTSLNPVFTIGNQIGEAIKLHTGLRGKEIREKTIEMLRLVGIPSPERRIDEYPHQLSGGMRQRVMIAMALSCAPDLLIADEPTTALDVTIQTQILSLMYNLKNNFGMAMILITHDLGIIAETAENVIIMYAGEVVEYASVKEIFHQTKHPYTRGLLNSIPKINEPLEGIKGTVPGFSELPSGCRFNNRCKYVMPICMDEHPDFKMIGNNHYVRCWLY
jgi:oligopeptide/dipeptide ABC transporter ATP-binding protein